MHTYDTAAATTPTSGAQPSPSRGGHRRVNSRETAKTERGDDTTRDGAAGAAGEGAAAGGAGGVLAEGGGLGPSLTGMLGGQFGATDFGR